MRKTDRQIHFPKYGGICKLFFHFCYLGFLCDCCIFISFPSSLLSSLLPSLPLFLSSSSHFICLLNQRKADLLPFNFTSLGKHCMNVIPYGECCQHFCWYQSWIYSRDSSFMSLVKKKKKILWLSHWPWKDFGLNSLHDVRRVFGPGPCYDSQEAGLGFSALLSTQRRRDLTMIMFMWSVEMASPDKPDSMVAFNPAQKECFKGVGY